MKGTVIFALVGLLVWMLFSILFTGASQELDQMDGGNAQVVRIEIPPLSGTPEYDLKYAETYRTYAEGNKANADGDAATTKANAEAVSIYTDAWLTILLTVMILFILLVIVPKVLEGIK